MNKPISMRRKLTCTDWVMKDIRVTEKVKSDLWKGMVVIVYRAINVRTMIYERDCLMEAVGGYVHGGILS